MHNTPRHSISHHSPTMQCRAIQPYAALCCAVPCLAVTCRAVLCCAVPCHAVQCSTVLCHALQYVPYSAVLCLAMLCSAVWCSSEHSWLTMRCPAVVAVWYASGFGGCPFTSYAFHVSEDVSYSNTSF